MMDWFIARLKEPSTHAGIAGVATGLALLLPPGSTGQQIAGGVALMFGGAAAKMADKK
jgi:hypothetical protein